MSASVGAPGERRTTLSRVTLVTEGGRRTELVVPSGEPVGALLPELLRLLGERPAGPGAQQLVTADGTALAPHHSLAAARLPDGAELHLVQGPFTPGTRPGGGPGADAAAPLEIRGGGWGPRAAAVAAGAAGVLLGAVAGAGADRWYGGAAPLWLGVAAVLSGGVGAALAAARTDRRAPGAALLLLGGTLGAYATWYATPGGAVRLAALAGTAAALLGLFGLCAPWRRAAHLGAAAVLVSLGAWEAGLALTTPARTGAVLGLVGVLVLGQLPRHALTSAGLTGLDDRRAGATPVSRHRVAAALGATHRTLAPATVAAAVSTGAGGWLAAGLGDAWAVAAALLLGLVLCARARAYPLAVQVAAVAAAGCAACLHPVLRWAATGPAPAAAGALLCLLAALPAALLTLRTPDALRRAVARAEPVAVVALIPVTVGALGGYALLRDAF
ncbi:EsaB/YukD family protein [Streptomyces sp. NPDC014733]|uniref:EsaB/YukD family protein n=1 Tax=Streptomyces sp. NPDC014733 TaxID=3364885 RepID=UPI0036F8E6E3